MIVSTSSVIVHIKLDNIFDEFFGFMIINLPLVFSSPFVMGKQLWRSVIIMVDVASTEP